MWTARPQRRDHESGTLESIHGTSRSSRLPYERLEPGCGRNDVCNRQARQFQFGIDPEATDDVRRSTNAIYSIDEEHVVPVEWQLFTQHTQDVPRPVHDNVQVDTPFAMKNDQRALFECSARGTPVTSAATVSIRAGILLVPARLASVEQEKHQTNRTRCDLFNMPRGSYVV